MTVEPLSKVTEARLIPYLRSYYNKRKYHDIKGIYVQCDKTNSELSEHFGLVVDDNRHDLGGYSVNYDWKVQCWYVYKPL